MNRVFLGFALIFAACAPVAAPASPTPSIPSASGSSSYRAATWICSGRSTSHASPSGSVRSFRIRMTLLAGGIVGKYWAPVYARMVAFHGPNPSGTETEINRHWGL